MASTNIETFCGGTFNFYVGPEKVRFILYKNLVARFSKPLEKMMSNGMKESEDGEAFLEHVDVGTFGRFAEYIHSGDYSAAAPVEVEPEPDDYDPDVPPADDPAPPDPDPEPPNPEPAFVDFTPAPTDPPQIFATDTWTWGANQFTPKSKKKSKKKTHRTVEEIFPQPFPIDPTPGPNASSSTSYTPTFASHVGVYHFAQQYLVPGLKELSGQKLSDALNVFQCYHERVEDICDIVRFIYNHEDGSSDPSSLHDAISEYATNNFRELMSSVDFKTLLTEGGEFPADLCSKLARLLEI